MDPTWCEIWTEPNIRAMLCLLVSEPRRHSKLVSWGSGNKASLPTTITPRGSYDPPFPLCPFPSAQAAPEKALDSGLANESPTHRLGPSHWFSEGHVIQTRPANQRLQDQEDRHRVGGGKTSKLLRGTQSPDCSSEPCSSSSETGCWRYRVAAELRALP